MSALPEYDNVTKWLEGCQRPLVIAHRRPDGDALGAMAGLSLALQVLGRAPLPTLYEPFPERYDMLREMVPWQRWDTSKAELAERCDAVIVLDTCSWQQLGPIAEFLPRAPRTLVIDHHPTHEGVGLRAHDARLLDPSAGAACLLIAEWVKSAGIPLFASLASALLLGLATDTGWFRFPSTDPRAMRVAADLMEAGAPAAEIYRSVYEREPVAKLRLIARMLSSLELHADERLAVMSLRPSDFEAAAADRGLTEEIVNEASRLGSTEATLLLIDEGDGTVRVNFRSKRSVDVSQLAQRFGGGGHARAAGARPQGQWDDLCPKIIDATVKALNEVSVGRA